MSMISSVLDALKIVRELLPYIGSGRYKRFFHKSFVFFFIANHDGVILDINQAFADFLGYRREDLIGKKFMRLVHEDDQVKTLDAMAALKSGGQVLHFKNRYLCSDGLYRALEWSAIGNGEIYATAKTAK